MVYYFKSRCGEYTIYMGKDKYENEELIKYGHPEDVWFHVDDLSSAHVYLRQKKGQTLDDITDELVVECTSLVKANSIAGCKKSSVYVIYTRWKNLKKTSDMVEGQVSYFRPENVRRIETTKNKAVVNDLNRTKTEIVGTNHLYAEFQHRQRAMIEEKKIHKKNYIQEQREKEKQRKLKVLQAQQQEQQREQDIRDTIEKTRLLNMNIDNNNDDDDSSSSDEDADSLGF